ncbi:unnamed protein product (macronuclear) [Paramecium tetraurelia]|uniref:Protein kinase domain-containing protein n=1 Tax=Paramecium tetraurelia TaxID=5888 RepID=A0C3Z5_PARTE|nr:uncharacterized protein GSPATT00034992001 [Paramecium tetraurelia]CAK65512.1 unnamed protein product [Paramecium tetraurelia]|eukprot:XP_001432909.1 hypothetical protein (macronuclear) [Paramecium tetraurelia strain d4-2]
MGVCSSSKKCESKSSSKNNFNPALTNTAEVQQTLRETILTINEQRINQNQTVQRKLKKAGTLSYFEYKQDQISTDKQQRSNRKIVQKVPQLRIKVTDAIASKDYSVYKGKVKIAEKSTLRVMQHNSDGQLVIMEQLPYDQEGKDYIEWLQKTNLDFYHIGKIHEIFIFGKQFQIISEFCTGGPLSLLLHSKLSEQVVSNIMDQIFEIINFLHSNKLVHNKLTIDSFSFYYDLQNYLIKLTDIRSLHKPLREPQLQIIQYASPEVLSVYSQHPHKSSDIWSLGIIAYQLMTRNFIYERNQDLTTIQEVKSAILRWTAKQDLKDEVSQCFEDLIFKMLHSDKNQRFKIEECQKHEFIVKHQNKNLNCFFKHQFTEEFNSKLQRWLMIYLVNHYEHSHHHVAHRIFDFLDKDKDGKLNVTELQEFERKLKQAQGQDMNIKVIQNLIGKEVELGLEDFILMFSNKSLYITHHNIHHSFKKLANKSSEITVKSLSKILNISEEEITEEFKNHQLYYESYSIPLEFAQYETIMNQILVVQNEFQ